MRRKLPTQEEARERLKDIIPEYKGEFDMSKSGRGKNTGVNKNMAAKTVEIEDSRQWGQVERAIAVALGETELQKHKGETPTPVFNVYKVLYDGGFLRLNFRRDYRTDGDKTTQEEPRPKSSGSFETGC